MMPKLPEPAVPQTVLPIKKDGVFGALYTEAQMFEYGRQTVEACAAVCERLQLAADSPDKSAWECGTLDCAEAIRTMLTKGED
jgi:hypothetical protein